jgi:Cu/Ag efflux pump CusA
MTAAKTAPWVIRSPVVLVIAALLALAAGGVSLLIEFWNSRESRPEHEQANGPKADPKGAPAAPPVLQVIATWPGAAAEEVERQLTVPLEVTLAGIPGLKHTRSQSTFGLARLGLEFAKGMDIWKARQEVINRLQFVNNLPAGATPLLEPVNSREGALLRYTLHNPRDAKGGAVYAPQDLDALQETVVRRALLRVGRVSEVVSLGGAPKRYEIHPDPDRLKRYGIPLPQLGTAIENSTANIGGDFLLQGKTERAVRKIERIGGRDPMVKARGMKTPAEAAAYLRAEEARFIREIRGIVIASSNNVPIRVGDVVEGGPLADGQPVGRQGVLAGPGPRAGLVLLARPRTDVEGRPVRGPNGEVEWTEEERVEGTVELREGEDRRAALRDVLAHVKELNDTPGQLLPGVRLEVYQDQAEGSDGAPLWAHVGLRGNVSLEEAAAQARRARVALQKFPEVVGIVMQLGSPDEAAAPARPAQARLAVLLKPAGEWQPAPGRDRPHTRRELAEALKAALKPERAFAWSFVDDSPADPQERFLASRSEGFVKLIGPDLEQLTKVGQNVQARMAKLPGVRAVQALPSVGQTDTPLRIDIQKSRRLGLPMADVNEVLEMALRGRVVAETVEGEQRYDIVLRWPESLRKNAAALLSIPVEAGLPGEAGPKMRVTLRDVLERPEGDKLVRLGATAIYREDGKRVLPIWFRVQEGRSVAEVARAAREAAAALLPPGYALE